MEKGDIRVQFTRKVLRESLVSLMKTKSILNIAVKDICEAAGVSRTTFYTYYKDQYDLLGQLEEEIVAEFDNLVMQYSPEGELPSARELVILI